MVEANEIDNETIKEAEPLQCMADKYSWYHTIKVADGVYTNSIIPHFKGKWDFILQGMENIDFQNKRVLDIGCRDGLFSFEVEKKGATEIIGIDNDISEGATEFLIPLFRSKVQMYEMSLYDLTPENFGSFDVIMFFGVLYHLRYPFWGLKKVIDCLSDNGILLLESGMLVSEAFENTDFLYCPVEESPYEATSCSFFNRKGLSTTMHSLKLELLDYRTISQVKKTSHIKILVAFAKRFIEHFVKTLGLRISCLNRSCHVTRQFFVFKKNMRSQLTLTDQQKKHDDINEYWDGVHDKFKDIKS